MLTRLCMQGYDGKVRDDIDHDAMMPAAWRVDKYLDEEEDEPLESLYNHQLKVSIVIATAFAACISG